MRTLVFLVCFLPLLSNAQTTPRFARYPISNSGFEIFLPAKPDPVTMEYSPDSSKVYTIECLDSLNKPGYHFGAIVVNMKEKLEKGEEEEMLIAYMDYLKTAFSIKESAGYGKGHKLETHDAAVGVIDFWKDKDGDDWSIYGWADTQSLVVMFEYGTGDYPIYNVLEMFKGGIRFPGD